MGLLTRVVYSRRTGRLRRVYECSTPERLPGAEALHAGESDVVIEDNTRKIPALQNWIYETRFGAGWVPPPDRMCGMRREESGHLVVRGVYLGDLDCGDGQAYDENVLHPHARVGWRLLSSGDWQRSVDDIGHDLAMLNGQMERWRARAPARANGLSWDPPTSQRLAEGAARQSALMEELAARAL